MFWFLNCNFIMVKAINTLTLKYKRSPDTHVGKVLKCFWEVIKSLV